MLWFLKIILKIANCQQTPALIVIFSC